MSGENDVLSHVIDADPKIAARERRDAEIEAEFPGINHIFDMFVRTGTDLRWCPRRFPPSEFPITAGIARIDTVTGKLDLIKDAENFTNDSRYGMSTNHAEKIAIERTLRWTTSKHLPEGAVLVSTVEPCAMCAAAFIHSLDNGQKGTIIYGASQEDIRGKGVELLTDLEVDDESETIKVTPKTVVKPFRTEPISYTVEKFAQERGSNVRVIGGYRVDDVLQHMKAIDVKKT